MLKYRCLVLDHDDTVVQSARTVNYPAMVEALRTERPGREVSYEEFTLGVFRLGPICYYLAFAAVALFLTVKNVERRRLW